MPYGFGEALKLTGATKSELANWSQRDVVSAGVLESRGKGYHRVYSFGDLVEIAIAHELNVLRPKAEVLRYVLRLFRDGLADDLFLSEPGRRFRQQFKLPASRPPGWAVLFLVTAVPGKGMHPTPLAYVGPRDDFKMPRSLVSALAIVVDVGAIIERIEAATGDHWQWSDRDRAMEEDERRMAEISASITDEEREQLRSADAMVASLTEDERALAMKNPSEFIELLRRKKEQA